MAKRDVIKYYTQCVKQYEDLNNMIKDLEKSFEEGLITQEQAEQFKPLVESMYDNCQRIAYIVYLLNLPTFSFKRAKESLKAKQLKQYFKDIKTDKETILTNNEEVLSLLEKTLKEIKETKGE